MSLLERGAGLLQYGVETCARSCALEVNFGDKVIRVDIPPARKAAVLRERRDLGLVESGIKADLWRGDNLSDLKAGSRAKIAALDSDDRWVAFFVLPKGIGEEPGLLPI